MTIFEKQCKINAGKKVLIIENDQKMKLKWRQQIVPNWKMTEQMACRK